MRGIVDSTGSVYFSIEVFDRHQEPHNITALLDTGYTGYLTLTPEIITAMGLSVKDETPVRVGDGTLQTFRRYEGRIRWAERESDVYIHAASGIPVIGTQTIRDGLLTIPCVDGAIATFEWLSQNEGSNLTQT